MNVKDFINSCQWQDVCNGNISITSIDLEKFKSFFNTTENGSQEYDGFILVWRLKDSLMEIIML